MGLEALLSSQIIGLSEAIDDRTASLLVAGTGITLTYDDGAGTLTIANTGLGGSTGSTDNRILRSDGTGGATVQASPVTIDDSGNISGLGTVACGAIIASVPTTTTKGLVLRSTDNGTSMPLLEFQNSVGSALHQITTGTATFANLAVSSGVTLVMCNVGSNGYYQFGSRSIYYSPASAQLQMLNISQTAGCLLDFATDSILKIRSRNNASAASLESGAITASGVVNVGTYTVATLPSASANAGALAQVTDSSVTTNGSTVAGSGSSRVPVFSDGTNWIVK
jgi:hypothetical protein